MCWHVYIQQIRLHRGNCKCRVQRTQFNAYIEASTDQVGDCKFPSLCDDED